MNLSIYLSIYLSIKSIRSQWQIYNHQIIKKNDWVEVKLSSNQSRSRIYLSIYISINVFIPNLVRQTRVSVFNFFSVANPQKFDRKDMMAGLGRQRASLSEPHLLSHSAGHISCRPQVRDAYVLIRGRRRPPPSHLNPCVSRKATDKGTGKRCPMQQEPAKSQNNSKEWKPNSAKIHVIYDKSVLVLKSIYLSIYLSIYDRTMTNI